MARGEKRNKYNESLANATKSIALLLKQNSSSPPFIEFSTAFTQGYSQALARKRLAFPDM
jgi:hypothetical protein